MDLRGVHASPQGVPTESGPKAQIKTKRTTRIINWTKIPPPHLRAPAQAPPGPTDTFQLLTSINNSHICHVTQAISRAPVRRPAPVIAEVMPALTEHMQPVWGYRVPPQSHDLALPAGVEGQTLLEIPVIVSNSPELNCRASDTKAIRGRGQRAEGRGPDFAPRAREGWGCTFLFQMTLSAQPLC